MFFLFLVVAVTPFSAEVSGRFGKHDGNRLVIAVISYKTSTCEDIMVFKFCNIIQQIFKKEFNKKLNFISKTLFYGINSNAAYQLLGGEYLLPWHTRHYTLLTAICRCRGFVLSLQP